MRNRVSRFSVALFAALVLIVGACADMAGQLDQLRTDALESLEQYAQ